MKFNDYYPTVLREIEETLGEIDQTKITYFLKQIMDAQRIFIAGVGRTGLVMRCFAMRLMHLGIKVQILGDITTTAVSKNDLLLIGSGSGETGSLVSIATKAHNLGVHILLITINPDSSIGNMAQECLKIPAPSPKLTHKQDKTSIQPMGSLFEQSLLITLDCIVGMLKQEKNLDADSMFMNHANLE